MSGSLSRGICLVTLLAVLALLSPFIPTTSAAAVEAHDAGAANAAGWTVVFRSDNPLLWNTNAGDASAPNGYAMQLASAPSAFHFLKLTREDTGASVIIALGRGARAAPWKPAQLGKTATLEGDFIWDGGQFVNATGATNIKITTVGIARKSWTTANPTQQMVMHGTGNNGYRGWGFSRPASANHTQTFSWEGNQIGRTVFEISVKADALSDDEKPLLITPSPAAAPAKVVKPNPDGSTPPDDSAAANDTSATIDAPADANATQLVRLQSTIKSLCVFEENTGGMLGSAEDFILTATPGKPRGNTIPVTFTSKVGPEMHGVLDDVLRAVNVKYPHISAEKYEFSFEERDIGHEGPSIGAACGTLMLSLIENFEIDPKLAITGDVAANGKIHAIGGVAAKLRGAVAAHCQIVAMPAENYDQISDAFVYDGPGPLTNLQVLGMDDLDDAVAIARTDRDDKLKQAIDLFAGVQASLKQYPERIHAADTITKLNEVLELAPNHYSAKLLLALAQNQQPRTLSAGATDYYLNMAAGPMMKTVFANRGRFTNVTPAVVQDALTKLQKVRRVADPQYAAVVNAELVFVRTMGDFLNNRASATALVNSAQAVTNASDKLDIDQDLQEKMLHEGI